MEVSPELIPHAGSSSRSSGTLDQIGEEHRYRTLPSVIPDSQITVPIPPHGNTARKFSTTKEEISESALAQGFCWQPKKPNRPGQFSERVRKPSPTSPSHLHQVSLPVSLQKQNSSSPPLQAVPRGVPRGSPLDLPELGLQGSHSDAGSPSVQGRSKASCSPSISPHFDFGEPRSPPRPINPQPSSFPESSQETSTFEDLKNMTTPAAITFREKNNAGQAAVSSSPAARALGLLADGRTTTQKSHIKDHHGSPSLKAADIRRPAHNQSRQSLASTCGDLEAPTYHSPRSVHASSRNSMKHPMMRPVRPVNDQEKEKDSRHRSQSRTSNISRKRTGVRKQQSRPAPERKQIAMTQVAQYWNECMQIADEEKAQANWEIDRLHAELRQHELSLAGARSKLEQKANGIQELERRCKKLEEGDNHVHAENERLEGQLETARDQLAESHQRADTLRDKFRVIRSKLNEAIKEQQQLFLRSQAFCEAAKKELEEEKSKHAAYSETIDVALETSRTKREAMKKGMDEFRAETERTLQQKDQAIAVMQNKLEAHEAQLLREREVSDSLRSEVELNKSIQHTAQSTETKLDSVLELFARKDEEHREQVELTHHLSQKVDLIFQLVKSAAEDSHGKDDIQALVESVEQKLANRVMPVVLTVLSRQDKTEATLSGLVNAFQNEAQNIASRINEQDQRRASVRAEDRKTVAHIVDVCQRFQTSLQQTNVTCQHMEEKLDSWSKSDAQIRQEAMNACQDELNRQLNDRNDTINELQRQVQLITEDYASRVEGMRGALLRNDKSTKESLDLATAQLHRKLDVALNQERERFEQKLRESEAARNALKNQLTEAKEALAMRVANVNPEMEALRDSLEEERQEASQLKDKVRQFEQEAHAAGKLRERWRRDIQAIDRLRPQLNAVKEKIPLMDDFGARLDKIAQLNGVIHATTNYLTSEGEWVQRRLESRGQLPQEGLAIASAATIFQTGGTARAEATQALTQEEVALRKVIVHSPCVDPSSPSPPPSIEQEQRRRRDGTKPRSILKLAVSTVAGSSGTESQFFAQPANHSQYNRPVMGAVSTTAPTVNNKMIEQIRSGLVQNHRADDAWALPTVAEFRGSSQEEAPVKRRRSISGGMEDGDVKRPKTEQRGFTDAATSSITRSTQRLTRSFTKS